MAVAARLRHPRFDMTESRLFGQTFEWRMVAPMQRSGSEDLTQ
jgi:hypothetical protein